MKTPNVAEVLALGEALLRQTTEEDIAKLTKFAESRLIALGLSPGSGEDVVQRAFESILRGLETDQEGRRPRLKDVQSKEAFANYLRGAVASKAEAMTRRRESRRDHETYGDNSVELAGNSNDSPAHEVEIADLAAQLFLRRRQGAPAKLIETIEAWQSVYPYTDRIPAVRGQRKLVGEVRCLAQQVLRELISS